TRDSRWLVHGEPGRDLEVSDAGRARVGRCGVRVGAKAESRTDHHRTGKAEGAHRRHRAASAAGGRTPGRQAVVGSEAGSPPDAARDWFWRCRATAALYQSAIRSSSSPERPRKPPPHRVAVGDRAVRKKSRPPPGKITEPSGARRPPAEESPRPRDDSPGRHAVNDPDDEQGLAQLIESRARQFELRPALTLYGGDPAEHYTYGALDRASCRLAGAFLRAGVRPDDRIAVLCDARPRF